MFWNLIIGIAAFLLNLVLAPKPQNAKAASLEDFNAPISKEGQEIPVLFGTANLKAPNCVWFGDLQKRAVTGPRRYGFFGPRVVTGHKYNIGMHFILCHATADEIREIWVGEKKVFPYGSNHLIQTGSGVINIRAGRIFGGPQSEGGVEGYVNIRMGEPTQLQDEYLMSVYDGDETSAFRGVVSAILARTYIGTSPYLKPWEFVVKRIHKTSQGVAQWYDAKACIPDAVGLASTETGTQLNTPDGGPIYIFRQVATNSFWAAGSMNTASPWPTYVWDLRDGSARQFDSTGYVGVGGYCYITRDGVLITRSGGDPYGSGDTTLEFRSLADPDMGITQTIDLGPYYPSSEMNAGFVAAEVTVGSDQYMFIEAYPFVAFRGPHIVLKLVDGLWAVQTVDIWSEGTESSPLTGFGDCTMGTQYVYAINSGGSSDYYVSMVDWTSASGIDVELTEAKVNPPGLTMSAGYSIRSINYNVASDEVIIVTAYGHILVYDAALTTLLRSGQPIATSTYIDSPGNMTGMSLVNSNTLLISESNSSSVIQKYYTVDLSTLEVTNEIPVAGSSLLNKSGNMQFGPYNAEMGGVVVLGNQHPTGAGHMTFWPLVGIEGLDMNPAHIIRECLTDRLWGMGYNEVDVDDDSFTYAADVLYDELFGLTLLWTKEERIEEFISMVLSHIDAYLYLRRTTGKFYLKLIRKDYDIDAIPQFDEDDIVVWDEVVRRSQAEAVNSVTVQYVNRRSRGQDAATTYDNIAQIQQLGERINVTRTYTGISRGALATRVAGRDQHSLGIGLVSGRIKGKRTLDVLNPGDPFRLVSARHNLAGEVMRVASLKFGDGRSNQIDVKFAEDVFNLSAEELVDTSASDWENPSNPPAAVSPRLVQEMPYFELRNMGGPSDTDALLAGDPGGGIMEVAGGAPSPDASDAAIYVNSLDTNEVLESFAANGLLSSALLTLATDITLVSGTDLDLITEGMFAVIKGTTAATTEIVRIETVASAGTVLTVSRGMLDTVPRIHPSGSVFIVYTDAAYSDYERHTDGDTVAVRLLTRTGLGELPLASAPVDTLVMNSRGIRPLRPAGVLVADQDEGPVDATGLSTINVRWSFRNRLTDLTPAIWTDPTQAPEAGQTTIIEALTDDLATVLATHSGLTATSFDVPVADFGSETVGQIRVGSERGGYREWQPYDVQVILDATITDNLDMDGALLYLDLEPLILGGEGAPTAPVFTVDPVITGASAAGSTLTISNGTVTGSLPITYSYQWKSDGSDVGTDSNTYVSTTDGEVITGEVTATNAAGNDTATSSNSITVAALTDLVTDTGTYTAAGDSLPAYATPYTDPNFGIVLYRVTGDAGDPIGSIPGSSWGDYPSQPYQKNNAWNADGSLIYLQENHGGSGQMTFLDGTAPYAPYDTTYRSYPAGWVEGRWHETDPDIMVYVTDASVMWYHVSTDTSTTKHDFSATYDTLTIGEYAGELSQDSKIIPLIATTGGGTVYAVAYNIDTDTVLCTINATALSASAGVGITEIENGISPLGNYMYVMLDNEAIYIYHINGTPTVNFPWTNIHNPSHFSMAVFGGVEYIVGSDRHSGGGGHVARRRMSDGASTTINSNSFAYATGANTHYGSWPNYWVISDYWPDSGAPYHGEICITAMDGSVVGRLCHHHKSSFIDYNTEPHPSLHPFDKKFIFKTDWDNSGGPASVFVGEFMDRELPGVG